MQPKMSDVVMRDYAIKLFGKTISLSPPDEHVFARSVAVSDQSLTFPSETPASTNNKDISMEEITRTKHEEDVRESTEQTQIEERDEEDAATSSGTRNTTDPHLKTMKRPEKLLPCPRCESADTKFCYYNNHNMNQPRHFCKKCQRFWTEGGSMRKIPIGSGRRKNKKALVPEVMSMMMDFNFKSQLNESNYLYSGFPVTFCPVNSNRGRERSSSNVPKSLKIHDPSEAAKSSIWCTLGYEKSNGKTRNVFKAFESTTHERICRNTDCSSLVLQANPAALSRSLNFHENA